MDVKSYNEKYLGEKKPTLCPRCGISTLDKTPARNSLSRHEEGIYICSACGTDEAIRDYSNDSLRKDQWVVARW
ncbi:hypothetical protein [Enterococcus wangshanyuanii]|uniref:Restriction alleviation protein, Lar family n=1 Tax=Enterococcus wangshanyuanii TaxID=2005703 RepID=A0ABQ1NZX4_9ENTE|nr:hypothetical protein [Enterococcus wangshanyuanii]GGC88266.1 hypothetical protein GCM10011573_17350 [Enterococcus wangshanyuanii]